MRKRALCLLLAGVLLLSLTGCPSTPQTPTEPTTGPTAVPSTAPSTVPTEATAPVTQPVTEPSTEATLPTTEPTVPPCTTEPVVTEPTQPETQPPETEPPETTPPETQPPETQPPAGRETATVTHEVKIVNPGNSLSSLPPLDFTEFTVVDPDNTRGLSTDRREFSYGVASGGRPHNTTVNNQARFDGWGTNGLSWDNRTSEKVLYLTFDCGYAYRDLVSRILDTLQEKQVTAAFFCTLDFLKSSPIDTGRMVNEGHIIGNHSTTHPDCTYLSRERLAWELLGADNYLRANFGYASRYFRFPTGAYSENALELVNSLGYRSIFWSIAHVDWDPNNQPGEEVSFNTVTSRLHPGAVILLHATSPDNAAILADFIDYAREQGYEFRSLDQYPGWN